MRPLRGCGLALVVDPDDSETRPVREEPFPERNVKDDLRGFKFRVLTDGLEPTEGDLEPDFLGKGKVSSGVWLNLSTRSFSDVCRFRVVFRAGLDLAALRGDLSDVEG